MSTTPVRKVVARNRKARHEYHVLDTFEAGLVLRGTEVKSLRQGAATLVGSFVRVEDGEAWLVGCQIPEYEFGNNMNHDPLRRRKLLLHTREIRKLHGKVRQDGLTVVPLELYFSGALAKVEIALAQGKKQADKRQALKKREAGRDVQRTVRRRA